MKTFLPLLQAVKAHIPPSEFYRNELPTMPPVRGCGWQDGGLCPFHDDHYAGSLRVNLETGAFRCFSCNEKGGDIIAYFQKRYDLSFCDALHKLADEWGI